MKSQILLFIISTIFSVSTVFAADQSESPGSCKQCGMDRVAFAYSRMLILYADGTTAAICSLNCATIEMKSNKAKRVKSLKVADLNSKKLVNAETATWVIGGSKPGVMTEMPKWAFARKEDAQKFVRAYGGRVASFSEALNLAIRENE